MKTALLQPRAPSLLSRPRHLAAAIWRYRGFVASMVQRELRQRYAQSVLGSLWNVIHPLTLILVYTLVFSQVMKSRLPGNNLRFGYSIYLCAGLLPWTLFSASLDRGVGVFVEQANLIKKVNFPRVTLPVIVQLSALADFAIIFAIYVLFLLAIGWFPGWSILAMLPLLAIQQAFSAALGLLLGCVNVYVRDTKQIIGIVLQFWFWFTPVVYASSALPPKAVAVLRWNPVWPLFNAYHELFLQRALPAFDGLWLTIACAVVLGAMGMAAYRKLAPGMTDEL